MVVHYQFSADYFCKPTPKTSCTLICFSDKLCIIFSRRDYVGLVTKRREDFGLKLILLYLLPHQINLIQQKELNELVFHMPMLQIRKIHTTLVIHVSNFFPNAQTFCCKPEPLYATHYTDLFFQHPTEI